MTQHDFIFSDQRRHCIARHVAFWILWCVAFNLFFHYPIHVFKGWDTSGPGTRNFRELGPLLFFIKALLVNCFFGVIIPQIALTYVLLYWLLPNYYFRKKNPFLVGSITICVLLIFYFIATGFKYSGVIYNILAGYETSFPPYTYHGMHRYVLTDQISSLPIILGLALMIKLVKRWVKKKKETEILAREKAKAELQLLKAQVHPHFLFNTINNIYFFTLTNSAQAPSMIKKLSGLLNYILNECDQPLVPLEKEIKMIHDYMALERLRYAEHMQMTINMEENYTGKMIAPLLLIPFVENSFKHGASKMITDPWVKVDLRIENNKLYFTTSNSKPATNDLATIKGNIGLRNVKRRLELLYPGAHELNISSDVDSYTVRLSLELHKINDQKAKQGEINPISEYAMA